MAILSGDEVEKYGATQQLETSGAAVTDGAFAQATTILLMPDDVKTGAVAWQGTFTEAPNIGTSLQVYIRTPGANVPSPTFQHQYVGEIPLDASQATQAGSINFNFETFEAGQSYEVYIRPGGGVTLTAGWTLSITPKTVGPKA